MDCVNTRKRSEAAKQPSSHSCAELRKAQFFTARIVKIKQSRLNDLGCASGINCTGGP